MTLSRDSYFYVDHEKKRNVIFFRKGTAVDLSRLEKMTAGNINVFKETTFVELGEDVKRVSDDVVYTDSCNRDGRLRFYEEDEKNIYFLWFSTHRNAFLAWEFTKEAFTQGVVRINFGRAIALKVTPVECAKVEKQITFPGEPFLISS